MANRRRDELIPLEAAILETALLLRARGVPDFWGFQIAREMEARGRWRNLVAHNALYKALARLTEREYLRKWREDEQAAFREGRPVRWYYEVTAAGEAALAAWQLSAPVTARTLAPKVQP